MCKYCKNLKRIKDLEEKDYQKIIDKWKRKDYEVRKLLGEIVDFFHAVPVPFNAYKEYEKRINDFLQTNWIGK